MAITVPFDLAYELEVKSTYADVFDLLSDVPTSASFFPKMAKLVDLGQGAYRWEMEKVGTAQINIRPSTPRNTWPTRRRAASSGRRCRASATARLAAVGS